MINIFSKSKDFTEKELGVIAKGMGDDFNMRLSTMGNPILTHRKTIGNNVIFSFYKRKNGVIIRRRLGYSNPFGSGNVLNSGKPFKNVSAAMKYFGNYVVMHPDSLVG